MIPWNDKTFALASPLAKLVWIWMAEHPYENDPPVLFDDDSYDSQVQRRCATLALHLDGCQQTHEFINSIGVALDELIGMKLVERNIDNGVVTLIPVIPANGQKVLFDSGPNKPKKSKAPRYNPDVPPHLRSKEFDAAWSDWIAYRVQRKLPNTPRALDAHMRVLAEMDLTAAIKAIDTAISSAWKAIWPVQTTGGFSHGSRNEGQVARRVGPGQRYQGKD